MPARSALAHLQQFTTFAILAAALGWAWWKWPQSPAAALLGGLLIALSYTVLLALQFLLMTAVGRTDPVPRPSLGRIVYTWLAEAWYAALIFAWRQPFRWREVPDRVHAAPPGQHGIVFVHGFACNRGFWTPWMKAAQGQGLPFIAVNMEPVYGSIDDYCPTIDAAVATLTAATGRPPMLVCHSMGGLAARAWLRRCGGAGRVARVVTIGSPHGGTWMARFSHLHNGREMRMAGDWIAGLGRDTAGIDPRLFTCWYSNCDNMVFPASTATLRGADNRFVPGAAHVHLAFHPQVMQHTLALAGAANQ